MGQASFQNRDFPSLRTGSNPNILRNKMSDELLLSLLRKWAFLEPRWCRIDHKRARFGPEEDEDWVAFDWEFVPWRESGALQIAVQDAIKERGWEWQKTADGTVIVGPRGALTSIVMCGDDFSVDLLNAYVQRLEMGIHFLHQP